MGRFKFWKSAPVVNPVEEEIAARMPALHEAATLTLHDFASTRIGDVEEVRRLLADGADVNEADGGGTTPMHVAAEKGHEDIMTLFCSLEADVNTADNCGKTPMIYAAMYGHKGIMTLLCSLEADVNKADNEGTTPLHYAARGGHKEIITLLYSKGAVEPVLHDAAYDGDVEEIRRLVDNGADVNQADEDGRTPMHVAARFGQEVVITLLQSLGGNINQADENGCTPMHDAAEYGHEEVITLLHSLGGEVNQADKNGMTLMHLAALGGDEVVISLLHSLGGKVNQADISGRTPILIAAALHHDSAVTVFLSLGASIPTDDKTLKTVDDNVEFFKTLNMFPEDIPTIEENLRSKDIGSIELFAASNSKDMYDLLGIGHDEGDVYIYYNIVKRHQTIQDDRAQSISAAKLAEEALNSMDNPEARDKM